VTILGLEIAPYSVSTGTQRESYSYDPAGNRTMTGYTTDTGNQLTADGTYTYSYDNEGNLTAKVRTSDGQRTEYTWDVAVHGVEHFVQ